MLGKNLTLSYFINDPRISNAPFLETPAIDIGHFHIEKMSPFGTIGEIHVDSLVLAVLCMILILVTCWCIVPRLTSENAGGTGQSLLEMYYGFIEDITKDQIGSPYKTFYPLIASIFIFVLIANFIGVLIPWKAFEFIHRWPRLGEGEPFEVASPTTDFNVTFALATIALLTYFASGFWAHGFKYLKIYFSPLFFIEWMDLIIRPATLALRLMMVITADELMRAAALAMVPMLLPVGVMGFELFIGIIQAFVFSLLTSIYIGLTVSHH
jgi:F-type H+-transporting ATPase subunit a